MDADQVSRRSVGAVDVCASRDIEYRDHVIGVVDCVAHSIAGTASSGILVLVSTAQRFAHSLWILKQRAENELEDSRSHTERQAAADRPAVVLPADGDPACTAWVSRAVAMVKQVRVLRAGSRLVEAGTVLAVVGQLAGCSSLGLIPLPEDGLLKRRELVRGQEHQIGSTLAGEHYSAMGGLDLVGKVGEVRHRVVQRLAPHAVMIPRHAAWGHDQATAAE